MGNNNSKEAKAQNENNQNNKNNDSSSINEIFEYNNLKEKEKKSLEYLNFYFKASNISEKKEYIKKAINLNDINKTIVLEYLKTICDESNYKEELNKYQVIFTPDEIKLNKLPIEKIKTEKEKLIQFFEEIFAIDTTDKEKLKEFLNKLLNAYKKINHFKLPITYDNQELYFYKNYCLILEKFNYLLSEFKRIKEIIYIQKYKDKIRELFKCLNHQDISEKMSNFIFMIIITINDSSESFEKCYYRIVDSFLDKKNIIKEINKHIKPLLSLYNSMLDYKYDVTKDTFVISHDKKIYFELDNFSSYSPYIVLKNIFNYDNKFQLTENKRLESLNFINFFKSRFYIESKERMFKNFKKIINTKLIKTCIKNINKKCNETNIDNLTKEFFNSTDIIEKYIDIYPFDHEIGITDKYSMNIYIKGFLFIPNNLPLQQEYKEIVFKLFLDACFRIIFIHEFCGHFMRVYLYYMSNNKYIFYTPRNNIKGTIIQDSGFQIEYLLFDRFVTALYYSEIIYIINENNYLIEDSSFFKEGFKNQFLKTDDINYYKGEYEKDLNKIIKIGELLKLNLSFSLKDNSYTFNIGMCYFACR